MTEVVFVDTNILVYAHDSTAGEKHIRAVRALDRLWDDQTGRISVQVLQECYVTVTKKLATEAMSPIGWPAAARRSRPRRYASITCW